MTLYYTVHSETMYRWALCGEFIFKRLRVGQIFFFSKLIAYCTLKINDSCGFRFLLRKSFRARSYWTRAAYVRTLLHIVLSGCVWLGKKRKKKAPTRMRRISCVPWRSGWPRVHIINTMRCSTSDNYKTLQLYGCTSFDRLRDTVLRNITKPLSKR